MVSTMRDQSEDPSLHVSGGGLTLNIIYKQQLQIAQITSNTSVGVYHKTVTPVVEHWLE